jgi:hypothetical protein
LGGVPPAVVCVGKVRRKKELVLGPHREGAVAGAGVGVGRRSGGVSVGMGRRQSSKGAGVLLVFMVEVLYFNVVVRGELAFRNAPVGFGRRFTWTRLDGGERQKGTMEAGAWI